MTTPSPFARSSLFDEFRISGGREQTVSFLPTHILSVQRANDMNRFSTFVLLQIEEMYSVPESFLEIEVKNPQTHGTYCLPSPKSAPPRTHAMGDFRAWFCRVWSEDVY